MGQWMAVAWRSRLSGRALDRHGHARRFIWKVFNYVAVKCTKAAILKPELLNQWTLFVDRSGRAGSAGLTK